MLLSGWWRRIVEMGGVGGGRGSNLGLGLGWRGSNLGLGMGRYSLPEGGLVGQRLVVGPAGQVPVGRVLRKALFDCMRIEEGRGGLYPFLFNFY